MGKLQKTLIMVGIFCSSMLTEKSVGSPQATSLEGGWVMGGGEFISHQRNPWFLKMRGENELDIIRYCIIRSHDFSLPMGALRNMVRRSLASWKDDITSSNRFSPYQMYTLASELYLEDKSCSQEDAHLVKQKPTEEKPLIFQFGILSLEQIEGMQKLGKNSAEVIGLTVRTFYDWAKMRGGGFIYIANDKDNDYFYKMGVEGSGWVPEGDHQDSKLFPIIMHELGHIYGLDHFGDRRTLMNEHFPSYILKKKYYYTNALNTFMPFNLSNSIVQCGNLNSEILFEYFDISGREKICFGYRVIDLHTIEFFTVPDNDSFVDMEDGEDIIAVAELDFDRYSIDVEKTFYAAIPKKSVLSPAFGETKTNIGEVVFSYDGMIYGPSITEIKVPGVITLRGGSTPGRQHQIGVRFSSRGVQMATTFNGKFYFDIISER